MIKLVDLLNEVSRGDLKKWEEVLQKIVDEEFEYAEMDQNISIKDFYQKARLNRKYHTDLEFRNKRKIRDYSRYNGTPLRENLTGCECSQCGAVEDLQRHHPSYESTDFIVLCRGCHTSEHHK